MSDRDLSNAAPPAPRLPPGVSRAEALALLRREFSQAGIESSALDARLLLLAALDIRPAELMARPETPLAEAEAARLQGFARRRRAREPVARILGEREFWGLPFWLSGETLVPRPETETVVETVLALRPGRTGEPRLLDLGTGSGCLLVALLHEWPRATGVAVDRAPGALALARRNACRNGVGERAAFVASDWARALRGVFDIIVSNPPYIPSPAVAALEPEVRVHDPRMALDGGADGLDPYRAIFGDADRLLAPGGLLVVEMGFDQQEALCSLAGAAGLRVLRVSRDLAGHPRALALGR